MIIGVGAGVVLVAGVGGIMRDIDGATDVVIAPLDVVCSSDAASQ
jgi:hypothetical protein